MVMWSFWRARTNDTLLASESDSVLLYTCGAMMIAQSLSGGEDIKISTFRQTKTPKSNLRLNVSLLNNDDWNICKMAFASPLSTFKYLKDEDVEEKIWRSGKRGRREKVCGVGQCWENEANACWKRKCKTKEEIVGSG